MVDADQLVASTIAYVSGSLDGGFPINSDIMGK